MAKRCIIPGCQNTPLSKLGACRKHHAAVREMVPKRGPPNGARVLAARVTDEAKAKLERAGKGTRFGSAYLVASRLLERISPEDLAKYLVS